MKRIFVILLLCICVSSLPASYVIVVSDDEMDHARMIVYAAAYEGIPLIVVGAALRTKHMLEFVKRRGIIYVTMDLEPRKPRMDPIALQLYALNDLAALMPEKCLLLLWIEAAEWTTRRLFPDPAPVCEDLPKKLPHGLLLPPYHKLPYMSTIHDCVYESPLSVRTTMDDCRGYASHILEFTTG